MAKDKNVISLDERRRGATRGRPSRGRGSSAADSLAPETPPLADAAAAEAPQQPVPGRLIWLFCPVCRTLEYTELEMAGGRVHNACGSRVQEAAVEVDLRAEHTIARINLERLGVLEQLLAGQHQRYEEYLHRLNIAAGESLDPYPVNEDDAASLPVADVDAFGLLVSRFFNNPAAHFPELAPPAAGAEPASGEDSAPDAPPPPPQEPTPE